MIFVWIIREAENLIQNFD